MPACCREYAHFNGARDHPGIHVPCMPRMSPVAFLQWSPGLLPRCTSTLPCVVCLDHPLQWSLGLLLGCTSPVLPRPDADCKDLFRQPLPKISFFQSIRGAPTKKSFYPKQLFLRQLYGIFTLDPGCRGCRQHDPQSPVPQREEFYAAPDRLVFGSPWRFTLPLSAAPGRLAMTGRAGDTHRPWQDRSHRHGLAVQATSAGRPNAQKAGLVSAHARPCGTDSAACAPVDRASACLTKACCLMPLPCMCSWGVTCPVTGTQGPKTRLSLSAHRISCSPEPLTAATP